MRKILFYLLSLKKVVLLILYPLFLHKGKFFERRRLVIESYLIFQPSKLRAKRIKRGLLKKIRPLRFINNDGIRLYAWYIPPKDNNSVILHLHGQAESILSHQDVALFALEQGFGLFMLSYRGHYKSWGLPTEDGVMIDIQAAMKQLKQLGIDEDKIVAWGHSLGTVFAVKSALKYNLSGIILQSPIKEIQSAAADVYNFYCRHAHVPFLARFIKKHVSEIDFIQKLDNINNIKKVKCPILICHSKTDPIAPYENSLELASKNYFSELFLATHGSHWASDWCFDKIIDFCTNKVLK